MSRMSITTPCPIPTYALSASGQSRHISTTLTDDTLTTEIEYTHAVVQELATARPRRKSAFQRKADRQAAVTVFEDVVEGEELVLDETRALVGKTLLCKPAQKRHKFLPVQEDTHDLRPLQELGQVRRRKSIAPCARTEEPVVEISVAPRTTAKGAMRKDPRRRTIFVPAEDTTLMTIHPGANSTDRLNDTFQFSSRPVEAPEAAVPVTDPQPSPHHQDHRRRQPHKVSEVHTVNPKINSMQLYGPKQPARKARMSLAVAPKRMPLQHLEVKQNVPATDVVGQNGGKENVPPGYYKEASPAKKSAKAGEQYLIGKKPQSRSRGYEPTTPSRARQALNPGRAVPTIKPVTRRTSYSPQLIQPMLQPEQTLANPKDTRQSARDDVGEDATVEAISEPVREGSPRRIYGSSKTQSTKLLQYPVLTEDVSQPQLYEENWLNHQEIAMTELINDIFSHVKPKQSPWQLPAKTLRERMIDVYHRPLVTTLSTRIQASLLYGALSQPKDMPQPPDPASDVGLQKRFLSLWLDNYEEQALRAAAEVVVGRQVRRTSSNLPPPPSAGNPLLEPCKSRKALTEFLETFLIRVEDLDNDENEPQGQLHNDDRRWRKIVLRSTLLIWLLDRAKCRDVGAVNSLVPWPSTHYHHRLRQQPHKSSEMPAITGCLFQCTSALKTSTAVLRALSSMLLPYVGDVVRILRHLDYEVGHVQDPLDEVDYYINNIAIDLRDGIFLARLTEVLLFCRPDQRMASDDAVTIHLPDTTVLESAMYTQDGPQWPGALSQHLKMPCIGRAQKLHNVQLALSALDGFRGPTGSVVLDVKAEDVVNGHREKTMSLLWSLVSNFGLAQLIDWTELRKDVRRAGGDLPGSNSVKSSQHQKEDLLQAWAAAHCTQHGVQVTNLTTSFSGGRAFTAILNDYAPFLPSARASAGIAGGLKAQLRSLGCSAAFIRQLTASYGSFPSRSTTVSSLALLASRLLPLARRHNAAVFIQRAFKRKRSWVIVSQRVMLMRLARDCAIVVQTKDKLIAAAIVLQRAWRIVLEDRVTRLNRYVEAFQVIARAWMIRTGRIGHTETLRFWKSRSFRVTDGW